MKNPSDIRLFIVQRNLRIGLINISEGTRLASVVDPYLQALLDNELLHEIEIDEHGYPHEIREDVAEHPVDFILWNA